MRLGPAGGGAYEKSRWPSPKKPAMRPGASWDFDHPQPRRVAPAQKASRFNTGPRRRPTASRGARSVDERALKELRLQDPPSSPGGFLPTSAKAGAGPTRLRFRPNQRSFEDFRPGRCSPAAVKGQIIQTDQRKAQAAPGESPRQKNIARTGKTIAVGDGRNDLPWLEAGGAWGIRIFMPSRWVRQEARSQGFQTWGFGFDLYLIGLRDRDWLKNRPAASIGTRPSQILSCSSIGRGSESLDFAFTGRETAQQTFDGVPAA